tara:strand:- start:71564 stop:72409 length:846 start_codon:yes stop_codon:yes gene_type:complete
MNNKGMRKRQVYHSDFWEEVAEDDNPFATKEAYCHGYNVYEDILKKATWFEYLYVMFKGEKPTEAQAKLLEKLAIALANPGPREASVRAAMNGGVGGSTHAASLMAALAVGAGQYGGSHEVFLATQLWSKCGFDIGEWKLTLLKPNEDSRADIWHPIEHGPGFDPNGINCPSVTLNILTILEAVWPGGALTWLKENRTLLEQYLGYPLAISGIAAAAFYDLELNEDQASMLYLIFRLPGAAAHALEQSSVPWNKFPFFGDAIELMDDPGSKGVPNLEDLLS